MDLVTNAVVGLLVLGVVGSIVPLVPGGLLSLAGVYLFWWHTGYAEPTVAILAGLTVLGLLSLVVDHVAGPLAAKFGGASNRTVGLAVLVGLVLFVFAGPVGLVGGVIGTVFVVEFVRQGGVTKGANAALFAMVGVLGAMLLKVLFTGIILVAMVVFVM